MSHKKTAGFIIAGLIAALVLAMGVSHFASADPDGLDSVTFNGCELDSEDEIVGGDCIALQAKDHEIGGIFADYSIAGIDNPVIGTALAGALGVFVVFAIGGGLFWVIGRRSTANSSEDN